MAACEYADAWSRLITRIPGKRVSHAVRVAAERSGNRSIPRPRSRSTRMVPYMCPVRKVVKSPPQHAGRGSVRHGVGSAK